MSPPPWAGAEPRFHILRAAPAHPGQTVSATSEENLCLGSDPPTSRSPVLQAPLGKGRGLSPSDANIPETTEASPPKGQGSLTATRLSQGAPGPGRCRLCSQPSRPTALLCPSARKVFGESNTWLGKAGAQRPGTCKPTQSFWLEAECGLPDLCEVSKDTQHVGPKAPHFL